MIESATAGRRGFSALATVTAFMYGVGGLALLLSVLLHHDGMNPRGMLVALGTIAVVLGGVVLLRGPRFGVAEAEVLLCVHLAVIVLLTAGTEVDLMAFSNGTPLPLLGVYCGWFLSRRGLAVLVAGTLAWVLVVAARGDGVLTLAAIAVALQAPAAAGAVLFLQRRQQRLLQTDQLTGVLNRHGLVADAERLLRAADRRGRPLALAMIDLDDLRTVNNSQGHAAGDDLLQRASQEWTERLDGVTIGRFGGDEFLLLFPGRDAAEATALLAVLADQSTVRWTAGVAEHVAGESFGDLVERADRTMYARKAELRSGRR
ncbi:GGDEF domain-containing protein [Nocardioides sp.]|uniref:GGDEF domain-containing protein n=1 Tax=Nocardioides sp. TaxID=35761 RepID=UPI0039E4F225